MVPLTVAAIVALPAGAQDGSPITVVSTPAPNEPTNAIVFYATDDRQSVAPGEAVSFRIVVRNQRDADINEVRITARIPDYVIPTETSPVSEPNPQQRTIVWNNLTLGARAEQTYAIRAQIAPDAPLNHTIRTVAEINGPGIRGSFTDVSKTEAQSFKIADQAATTVAPVKPVTPRPAAVIPTAQTGAATNLFIAITTLGGIGLLFQGRQPILSILRNIER